jgi:hypothetical protein
MPLFRGMLSIYMLIAFSAFNASLLDMGICNAPQTGRHVSCYLFTVQILSECVPPGYFNRNGFSMPLMAVWLCLQNLLLVLTLYLPKNWVL